MERGSGNFDFALMKHFFMLSFLLKKLRQDTGKENADVIPLILYSDSTTLSQDQTVTAWPIYMTVANIPLSRRKHPG